MLLASIGEGVVKESSYDEDAVVRRGQLPSYNARSVALSKCPPVSVGSDQASHWTGVVEGEENGSEESSSSSLALVLVLTLA